MSSFRLLGVRVIFLGPGDSNWIKNPGFGTLLDLKGFGWGKLAIGTPKCHERSATGWKISHTFQLDFGDRG